VGRTGAREGKENNRLRGCVAYPFHHNTHTAHHIRHTTAPPTSCTVHLYTQQSGQTQTHATHQTHVTHQINTTDQISTTHETHANHGTRTVPRWQLQRQCSPAALPPTARGGAAAGPRWRWRGRRQGPLLSWGPVPGQAQCLACSSSCETAPLAPPRNDRVQGLCTCVCVPTGVTESNAAKYNTERRAWGN
jgi:hypothetical protein